jgi:hypothetical protein
VFPDVEVLLVAYLNSSLDVRACTELPAADQLNDHLPVVRIRRISGADRDYRLDRPVVDVDVFAASRPAAAALSGQVRVVLRDDLQYADAVQPTGVVTSVTTIVAPRWLPDPDTSLRRYSATYELCVHALTGTDVTTS